MCQLEIGNVVSLRVDAGRVERQKGEIFEGNLFDIERTSQQEGEFIPIAQVHVYCLIGVE